jgi:hypothetical protein
MSEAVKMEDARRTKPTGAAISAALVAFQAECQDVVPNAEADTGKFSYRYADLSTVLAELRPRLAKHGLAIVQTPMDDAAPGGSGVCVGVRTIILHKSGESIDAGQVLLPMTQQTPQGAGACITYARRYALGALAGIATDHDEDAASQQRGAPPAATPQRKPRAAAKPAPAASDDSPSTVGSHFDDDIGFGKFKNVYTWRQMTEGAIDGDRHNYLKYLAGQIDPNENKWSRERYDRVTACLAVYGKRLEDETPPEDGTRF